MTSSLQNACTFQKHTQTLSLSDHHSSGCDIEYNKGVSCYLEAIESHKESQDVVGALKDSENSQIPHHSLQSSVLRKQTR